MQIVDLEVTQAVELTNFYNEQFSHQPYYYPVTPEEFDRGVRQSFWGDEPYPNLSGEKLIVGKEKGRIVGFSHVAKNTKDNYGTFRFFSYQPGFRAIAQAILKESERYLSELGVSELWACGGPGRPGYRFHRLG
ncbi:hypothetical protein HYR99_40225 [Candidatus Poribacteria bacterium]|nr:hypothetical protein [Candidatus Poribacteria bacterium]